MYITDALTPFEEYLRVKDRADKTISGYKSDLRRFRDFFEKRQNGPWYVEDTTPEDIEVFFDYLRQEGLKVASIARIQGCLKSFAKFTVKKKIRIDNFMSEIESIEVSYDERTFLTKKEALKFISEIRHPVIRLFARTLLYTGLRVAEGCNLHIRDVDFERNVIRVYYKGKLDRIVPISPDLLPHLRSYRLVEREYSGPDSSFFATTSGALSTSYVTHVFDQTNRILGWDKRVTPHTLRHTFASLLCQAGVQKLVIQRLLGHKDDRATMLYTHAYPTDLTDAITRL